MKIFPLHMEDDLHKKLKLAATTADKPLHKYILDLLTKSVTKGN